MSERPETNAARAVCEANWQDGGFQGYSDDEWLAMLEKMERERDEAREALRELHEARSAPFPAFNEGAKAQLAWGDRIYHAHNLARALLARIDGEKA